MVATGKGKNNKKHKKYHTRKCRCLKCGLNRNKTVNKQLRNKKGKYYKLWKKNLLAALKK